MYTDKRKGINEQAKKRRKREVTMWLFATERDVETVSEQSIWIHRFNMTFVK
jgi:hypothetical protein